MSYLAFKEGHLLEGDIKKKGTLKRMGRLLGFTVSDFIDFTEW